MKMYIAAVKAFQEKLDIAQQRPFPADEKDPELFKIGEQLIAISKKLEKRINEPTGRWCRTHLNIEELGEGICALADGNLPEYLDALADRLYILFGEAVMYMDLPLAEAFAEVHASNMTKEKMPTDASKERVRDKGPNYKPPCMDEVIKQWRSKFQHSSPYEALKQGLLDALKRDHVYVGELSADKKKKIEEIIKS